MKKPVLMNSIDEYFAWIKDQCSKHGRGALKARSYCDPKLWQFVVGIEGPDGWCGINVRNLKKLAFTHEEIVEKYRIKLLETVENESV